MLHGLSPALGTYQLPKVIDVAPTLARLHLSTRFTKVVLTVADTHSVICVLEDCTILQRCETL